MSLPSCPPSCSCCERLVPTLLRKSPLPCTPPPPTFIPSTCCSLLQYFPALSLQGCLLLWRASWTSWDTVFTWGIWKHLSAPPFPPLPNTAVSGLVGWLTNWLIATKAASASPPPLPFLCLWAPTQRVSYHQALGFGQSWSVPFSPQIAHLPFPPVSHAPLDLGHPGVPWVLNMTHLRINSSLLRDLNLSQSLCFLHQTMTVIPASWYYHRNK